MIVFANEARFDFGSAEYRRFFERFGLTPFQHPDWLGPFYRRLPAAAGAVPLILVGREVGEIVCVMPMLRHGDGEVTFAFLGVTDYACPVVDPARLAEIAGDTGLGRLLGDGRLNIAPVHEDHHGIWQRLLGCEGKPMDYGAHAVPVSLPTEVWRHQTYGRNMLSGLGRKGRRLKERGALRLEQVAGQEARRSMELAAMFRAGRFAGDPLQVPVSLDFYGEVAASENGLARTFRMSLDGDVVALMFGLTHGTRFHYVVLACNYARYARYSPGLIILDMAIAAWAGEGGDVFDFTIGDEAFKAAFGCRRTPMYRITG